MSQDRGEPDNDDVLAKMDALLKKHHDALAKSSPPVYFPVLTEIVEEVVEVVPVLTEVVEDEPPTIEFYELEAVEEAPPEVQASSLDDQVLSELDRQIRAALEQRLPFHIVEAVDKALPVVMEEFSMQLEKMVREAVTQELQRHMARQGGHGDTPE